MTKNANPFHETVFLNHLEPSLLEELPSYKHLRQVSKNTFKVSLGSFINYGYLNFFVYFLAGPSFAYVAHLRFSNSNPETLP
jgi:hypothetical protein